MANDIPLADFDSVHDLVSGMADSRPGRHEHDSGSTKPEALVTPVAWP